MNLFTKLLYFLTDKTHQVSPSNTTHAQQQTQPAAIKYQTTSEKVGLSQDRVVQLFMTAEEYIGVLKRKSFQQHACV